MQGAAVWWMIVCLPSTMTCLFKAIFSSQAVVVKKKTASFALQTHDRELLSVVK